MMKLGHRYHRSGGPMISQCRRVNSVKFGPVPDARDVDSNLDQIFNAAPGGVQNRDEIAQRYGRLLDETGLKVVGAIRTHR